MSKTLQTRIQLKHDTEANWKTAGTNGFKPLAGELIIYDDTIGGAKIKIGNGENNVNDLPFTTSMHYIPANLLTVTAGSSTSNAYLAAKWKISDLDGITQPYDGLTIALRTPAVGYSGGILLSIDNGTTYYPLVRNVNTLITTNYAANATIVLTFNATQTAKPYLTAGTQTEVTGCWQTADYDANSYAYVRQYYTTTNNNYPLLFKYDAGTSTTESYVTKYTRYGNKMYANPSTGTITSTKLVLTDPSTSAAQTFAGFASTGELVEASDRLFVTLTPTGTEILANANLNTTTYVKVGRYYCSKNVDAATLKNCPTNVAFMMEVSSPLSTTVDNENSTWVYRLRKITVHNTGMQYYQYCSTDSTAGNWQYGAWRAVTMADFTLDSTDTNGGSGAVGSATKPVYVNSAGMLTAGTYELKKTVPADAIFTDTTYNNATTSEAGLMSKEDKAKLNGIAANANNYSLPTASSSTLGGVKIGSNINISSGVISVPTGDKDTAGVTIVYPAASCTTFTSDAGTITPLAAQKSAELFAITRPPKRSPNNPVNPGEAGTCTPNNIVRWLNADGDVQDSKITIEDVTNTKDTTKKAQVLSIPAEGGKKMVYGYCTDQTDGTSFIGGVFDAAATQFPYRDGLAIGGTSGNLLWKGVQVATISDIPEALKNPEALQIGDVTYDGSSPATVTAKDLGLTGAMIYKGISTTAITDEGTQAPTIGGSVISIGNLQAGNVVLYQIQEGEKPIYQEFVWNGSKWELLGDEGSYKVKQSAITDPTASGTSKTFIASISQDANGVITATKKTVSTMGAASASAAGSTGLVPAPAKGSHASFLRGDGTWVVPADTHYTTKLFATSSSGTAHAATTNGNTYLRLFDNSTARQSIKITGSGATTVASDANGVITINSTDTNTTYSAGTGLSLSSTTFSVKLNSNINSTNEDQAATPKAVKTAYDKAASAETLANAKVAKAGDIMTGRLQINMANPHIHMKDTGYSTDWYFQAYQDQLAFGPTFASAVKTDKNGNMTVPGTVTVGNKAIMQYNSTTESLDFTFA